MSTEEFAPLDPGKRPIGRISANNERVTRRHGFGTRTEENQPLGRFTPSGKFGRMFPELKPLLPPLDHLAELGDAMKEMDSVDADGNPVPNPPGDNPNVPAGFTYLGQFIDHDITFDPTALQELLVDPLAVENFRTPMLDLDSLYGSGPVAQPYLYRRIDNRFFQVGNTSSTPPRGDNTIPVSLPHDLQRSPEGFGLIGDPRNDENLVVGQLHLAFMKFHNKVVDGLETRTIPRRSPIRKSIFEEARDLVIWHYQWIVVNDFLKRILDPQQFEEVFVQNNRSHYLVGGGAPYIPVEFSAAAYRFGHTMVREAYNYNRVFRFGGVTPATLALLFQFSGLSTTDPVNSVPIPSDWIIDWRRFFDIGGGVSAELSRALDPFLIPKLHNLPNVPRPNSLAVRNLQRGRSLGLPPGQSVAYAMGFEPLTPEQIATGRDGEVAARHDLHIETPLWYYILKEAEVQQGGQRLGQVGSRILAEVFHGILTSDSSSYQWRKPNWRPTLPGAVEGEFTMVDLLNFMGDINPIGEEVQPPVTNPGYPN